MRSEDSQSCVLLSPVVGITADANDRIGDHSLTLSLALSDVMHLLARGS